MNMFAVLHALLPAFFVCAAPLAVGIGITTPDDVPDKAQVTGIGGVFVYSNDAKALSEWYATHFGLTFEELHPGKVYAAEFKWRTLDDPERKGRTVFSFFQTEEPLPDDRREFRVNYRVRNLAELLKRLTESGVTIDKSEDYPYGSFAWLRDPEGNLIELWEPREDAE